MLVIEDEPAVQRMLGVILEPAGYTVTATDSAIGALGLVKRLRPDVILLDLGLPYRSGASFLAALKADPDTATVPVLGISGLAEMLPVDRRALANDVIAKPFDAEELLKTVHTACAPPAA